MVAVLTVAVRVFTFGTAGYFGWVSGQRIVSPVPVVGISPAPDGQGYWLVSASGSVYTYGDAAFLGSPGRHPAGRTGIRRGLDIVGVGLPLPDGGLPYVRITDPDARAFSSVGQSSWLTTSRSSVRVR